MGESGFANRSEKMRAVPATGDDETAVATAQRAAWWRRHRVLTGLGATVVVLALVVGVALFTPLLDSDLRVQVGPAASYEQAMGKADTLAALDGDEINPACRSRVVDQGQRSERAVVLLHGFTNCPAQFDVIAQAYADAGYSVVVPRLPGHGEADRLSAALSGVRPADLVEAGDAAVDIATGLAEDVTVVGLSGGGTLAGYLAAQRDEVDRVVLIAPLVVPKILPEFAVAPVARAFRVLPDMYWWWDGEQKAALADPPYAYPRFSFRSLGAFLAIGRAAQAGQPRTTTLDKLVVITNENDNAVSNAGVNALARALEPLAQTRVDYDFSKDLGYGHDLVDPLGENAENLAAIYPVIGPLLGIPALSP